LYLALESCIYDLSFRVKGGTVPRINWTRVILGGLLAGVVINISEFLVNGLLLADRWAAAMAAQDRSSNFGPLGYTIFILWGFLIAMFAMWLYAIIRPRFGAGPRTAAIAAIATWVPGSLLASMAPIAMDLYSRRMMLIGVAEVFVELVVGVLIGAWIYKEKGAA
jgi:hypothetical protein